MPELPELRIMSKFINHCSKDKKFTKAFHVKKGNIPQEFDNLCNFRINSKSIGKELILNLDSLSIYVFMGMSGNWTYVSTDEWSRTKFVRLRIDDETGNSLLLYGGYMGPKYSVQYPFKGTKRGPDPVDDFDNFKYNILKNLKNKDFDKPIYEVLLNQKYFNGIGNYLRSTIIYYADINPFISGREAINQNESIIDMCRDVALTAYNFNGGQIKDWKNPFDGDSDEFDKWVFYQKGSSIKDSNNRTFWFDSKWKIESGLRERTN